MKTKSLLLLSALIMPGCAVVRDNPEFLNNLVCQTVPNWVADCTDPSVIEEAKNILTNGTVKAQIFCSGLAFGSNNAVIFVDYNATRRFDGSCDADAVLAIPGPQGSGFIQSVGPMTTTAVSDDPETCTTFTSSVPHIQSMVQVLDGLVEVEAPGCTTTPGTTCIMPVDLFCDGINIDQF